MLRKIVTLAIAAGLGMTMALPAAAYDQALAQSYAQLFEAAQGAKTGKQLHFMKVEAFVAKVQAKQPMLALDVRTPGETGIFTAALPGSMAVAVNDLFTAENLDRLPTDQPIVVLCKSGMRAAAVGTALRHVGFDNVYILKGGFKALSNYLDAKSANTPLGPQHAGL